MCSAVKMILDVTACSEMVATKHRRIYDAYMRISVTPLIKTASLSEDAIAVSFAVSLL
jgi:hypothetical protein